jgi:4-carboxymuconolactone decarboxylase
MDKQVKKTTKHQCRKNVTSTLSQTDLRKNFMTSENSPAKNERLDRGRKTLDNIDVTAGANIEAALADIAPDFTKYLFEFPFGDIYSRPGLDLRQRELSTIAALTAMGNAQTHLKVHIGNGLNVGLTKEEIVEVIMQMAVFAGFPAALNGLFVAKELFSKRGI